MPLRPIIQFFKASRHYNQTTSNFCDTNIDDIFRNIPMTVFRQVPLLLRSSLARRPFDTYNPSVPIQQYENRHPATTDSTLRLNPQGDDCIPLLPQPDAILAELNSNSWGNCIGTLPLHSDNQTIILIHSLISDNRPEAFRKPVNIRSLKPQYHFVSIGLYQKLQPSGFYVSFFFKTRFTNDF